MSEHFINRETNSQTAEQILLFCELHYVSDLELLVIPWNQIPSMKKTFPLTNMLRRDTWAKTESKTVEIKSRENKTNTTVKAKPMRGKIQYFFQLDSADVIFSIAELAICSLCSQSHEDVHNHMFINAAKNNQDKASQGAMGKQYEDFWSKALLFLSWTRAFVVGIGESETRGSLSDLGLGYRLTRLWWWTRLVMESNISHVKCTLHGHFVRTCTLHCVGPMSALITTLTRRGIESTRCWKVTLISHAIGACRQRIVMRN